MRERCEDAGFADGGMEPRTTECEWPLEDGKGKEPGSHLELPGAQPCQQIDFLPSETCLGLLISKTIRY